MAGTPVYFLVAVVACGITEWVKNFFPETVKENKKFLAGLAAGISVVSAVAYQFANKALNPEVILTWQSVVTFTALVVGLSQTCYTVLLSTFKSIKTKLTEKASGTDVDTDAIADEVINKVKEGLNS